MFFKKIFTVLFSLMTLFSLFGCTATEQNETLSAPAAPPAANDFEVSVLKIGQADAIIMQTKNHCVIVDCGETDDGDEILEYLSDNGISYIDCLLITHFDKDHVGGAPEIIENISIGQIITPDYAATGDEYKDYLKAIASNGITPISLTQNMSFTFDDVLFCIYPPQKRSYAEGDNDFSLAVDVTHGENSFLFTGDAEAVRLSEIISQTQKEYNFLKFPHHGRYNHNTKKFIEAVKPAYSVITCSEKNPAEERVVDILNNAGCEVYYTKDGDVSVISDGSKIDIKQ